jgi:hypothetical protein
MNTDCFYAWTVQDLLPKIQEQSVIVMGKATFHKRKYIIQVIEEQGDIFADI